MLVMEVIEAQRASILAPHDHLHDEWRRRYPDLHQHGTTHMNPASAPDGDFWLPPISPAATVRDDSRSAARQTSQ
jgi:hypothetical protein